MKLYDAGAIIVGIVVSAFVVGYLSSRWLGDDNLVEETAEEVIEYHTGIDFDLTPDSPEKG